MNPQRRLITSGGGTPGVPIPQPLSGRWEIHLTGKVFGVRINGELVPIRYRGVSTFRLLDAWARGEDVSWIPRVFDGYNVLRVWPYVVWPDGWDAPSNDQILSFVHWVEKHWPGWNIELTLMTDDHPSRYGWANRLVDDLAGAAFTNLLLEGGNEPLIHKRIEVQRLYASMDRSPYLWSSGYYEAEAQEKEWILPGDYGTAHTPRAKDWARRGHDLLEYFNGDGPDVRHTPSRKPWVGDEPIRPDQVPAVLEVAPGHVVSGLADYRAHGGVCAQLGAGATFHYAGGRQHKMPTDWERACAKELLKGLTAFPANAPLLPYSRIVEPGQIHEARTYVTGPYMTRVWQKGAPPEGFAAIDGEGILCRKNS